MKPLPPIPIPPSVRWREFRVRFLPVIVFLLIATVTGTMWWNTAAIGTMQGIGEGVRSIVAAPQPGLIEEWLVEPYSIVEQGKPLVVVKPVDIRADFDHLRSLAELMRVRSQPSLAEDNAMSFERIRVELLKTKSELAIARVKLELAIKDVARNAPLYREKLVSEDIYELAVNTRDALKAEVDEKGKAVVEIERRLDQLRSIGEPGAVSDEAGTGELLARLEQAQGTAASNLNALTLLAPITGMVGLPQRQAGEFVLPGEMLLAISALRSDRVIGYLRQPYALNPEPGMPVRVTTKTHKPESFWSHILQVGAHVETITNSLAFIPQGFLVDVGLPIVVHVPDNVQIRPGEVVDLLIKGRSPSHGVATNQPARLLQTGDKRARL